jgi:uncharacterized protein YbjT (DUF2867 family)
MGGSGVVNLFNKKNIEFIKGDIRDAKLVKRAAEGVDKRSW